MKPDALMCEDIEAAARSRENVARRKAEGEDSWYNKTAPDSRYDMPYVNTKPFKIYTLPLIESRWNRR